MTLVVKDALTDGFGVALTDGFGVSLGSGEVFVPPPPPPPQTFPPAVRDWWDCDEWGRFFPGNCVRR